jgi:hypothetical protein
MADLDRPCFPCRYYLARNLVDREVQEDRALLEEGTHFETYALAIYTWMMFLYAHKPVRGSAKLMWRRMFRMAPRVPRRADGRYTSQAPCS